MPVKTEPDADGVKVPMHHIAGVIGSSCWETDLTQVVWATKWNKVVTKGLQPLRPMVIAKGAITVPGKSAVEISKRSSSTD